MDEMHEIKELLREIRDLQKAHFERYREFTQSLLDREQIQAADFERARAEQRRFREEVKGTMLPRWVPLVILAVVLVAGVGGTIFATILGAFMAPK